MNTNHNHPPEIYALANKVEKAYNRHYRRHKAFGGDLNTEEFVRWQFPNVPVEALSTAIEIAVPRLIRKHVVSK